MLKTVLIHFIYFFSFIVAPNVTDSPDSQTVLANDSVTFSCVAEGRPPPTITWLQQSTDQTSAEVEEDEGVSIVTIQRGARETVSNLTIQSAQPRDAVEYTCDATNVAGSDMQSATLTVHGTYVHTLYTI